MKITLEEEKVTYVTSTYSIEEDAVPEDRLKEVIELLNKDEHTEGEINTIANFCEEFNSEVSVKSYDEDSEYRATGVETYELESEKWIEYEMNKYAMEEEYNNDKNDKEEE